MSVSCSTRSGSENASHLARRVDNSELAARISSYELAYKMQQHAPEAVDFAQESAETLEAVRARQRPHTTTSENAACSPGGWWSAASGLFSFIPGGNHNDHNWDAHGDLVKNHNYHAGNTDKPIAGLIKDLKQRGLFDSTLIVWGGEFGRQPTAEYAQGTGRDHNAYGFTMWMAGGGIRADKASARPTNSARWRSSTLSRQTPARDDPESDGARSEPTLLLLRRPESEIGRRRAREPDPADHLKMGLDGPAIYSVRRWISAGSSP